MKELIKSKIGGLRESLVKFSNKVHAYELNPLRISGMVDLISREMQDLGFDKVAKDKSGNLIGVIKGYGNKESIVMLSHIEASPLERQDTARPGFDCQANFRAGIVSSVYTGALMKRALLPMTGDLIICCLPRLESCDYGIKYLFDGYLNAKIKKIKGVILCEPTDFNINIGHKGRMEYEIVVKGRLSRNFLENRGMNMLGTMFPLINELEKVSRGLPSDTNLGQSDLRIKDVRYSDYQQREKINEFRVVVDRAFIPEESESYILNKAKTIARNVYKQEEDISVNALLAKERVKTYTGLELVSEKEFKPWAMESHHPFVLESLKSLTESGFKSGIGYWKKTITEGSYTHGQLHIPTIGYGACSEESRPCANETPGVEKLEKAVFGQALIVQRNIGIPAFGWSSDEI